MANRFLNNIKINDEYTLPSADGTADQIIQTDGAGNLTFIDPSVLSVGESEQVHIACKNTSGVAISKGDPVYITGTVGTSFRVEIAAADASNSAKMPAVGLAESDLAHNAEGFVIVSGVLKNLTTDPLSTSDGTPSSNDTVYVKAGGGLTRTKPTGSGNLIQNVGKVGRVSSANSGSLAVSTIMRTNDVPNLTTGKIWVGSSTYTTESGVVHLDEANGRMGINANSPLRDLHVVGNFAVNAGTNEYYGVYIPGSGEGSDPSILIGDWHNASATLKWDSSARSLNIDTQYSTGAGTFNITGNDGASTFLTVNTSGNVGIGTTSPSEKLDVAGNIELSGNVINASNTAYYLDLDGTSILNHGKFTSTLSFGNFSAGSRGTTFEGYSTHSVVRTDSAQLRFFMGKSSTGVGTMMSLTDTGRVGIGTTSPDATLDIENSNGVTVDINSSSGDGQFRFQDNGITKWAVGRDNTQQDFVFSSSAGLSTDPVVVLKHSSGNVGIGTTSPMSKVHVFSPGYPQISLGSNAGNWQLGVSTGNEFAIRKGTSGSNFPLWIDSNSNIGIGTTSPNQKLEVSAATDTTISIASSDTSLIAGQNIGILEFASNNETSLTQAYTAFSKIKGISESNVSGTGSVNGAITFETASANVFDERMRITSSGNVGIGTTSPGSRLTVSGTNNATSEITLINTNPSTDNDWSITPFYNDQTLRFRTNSATTTVMTLKDNGNVGIGTDSPGSKLQVYSTALRDISIFGHGTQAQNDWQAEHAFFISAGQGVMISKANASNNTNRLHLFYNTSNGDAQYMLHNTSSANTVKLNTNGDSFFNGGNVGIGTTSPGALLDVDGGAQFNTNTGSTPFYITRLGNTDQALSIKVMDDNVRFESIQDEAADSYGGFDFRMDGGTTEPNFVVRKNAGNPILHVDGGGNVGIGNTSPSAKLEVSGNIAVSVDNRVIFDVDSDGFNYIKSDNANSEELTFYSVGPHHFKNGEDNSYENVVASNFVLSSDERLKENTYEIQNENINVNWKTFNFKNKPEEKRYGVVAQELEKDHPEFVNTDNQGFKSVKYIDLLIAKIAELENRIKELEK